VQIGGLNAPIIAVARGLIAVQVPYETAPAGTVTIDVFQNGQSVGSIPMTVISYALSLFDTGDRNNSLGLPALAALNQDGTVNSVNNPAPAGSVVSVFGSGAGILSPPLQTGALSPIPPAGPLSATPLYQACWACSGVLYFGSAPGLSTGVVQINIQMAASASGSGVRPQGIGIAIGESARYVIVPGPSGVVFVE
jgi:uncharacterized protein (TIGR03437 family)